MLLLNVCQVRRFAFAVINSTTILLPEWKRVCAAKDLKVKLLPRDVRTRWNSTYDMLVVALAYRSAIDTMTADKPSKQRKNELDEQEWLIIGDLVCVLEVRIS